MGDHTGISDGDYATIHAAVMETTRGRWFLAEYASRNRHADTEAVLAALARLEARLDAPAALPAPAAATTPSADEAAVDRVRSGILEMADAIARTKAEIAAIKTDGEDVGRFEEASLELDAIVDATEKATSDILSSAEIVQEMAWTLREMGAEDEICDVLDAKATDIYTACSFQDLTGQRTRKVINVLRYLEQRVNAMGAIWTGQAAPDTAVPPPPHLPNHHRGPDGHLLNGPSLPGEGLEQGDVDAMMRASEAPSPAPADDDARIEALKARVAALRHSALQSLAQSRAPAAPAAAEAPLPILPPLAEPSEDERVQALKEKVAALRDSALQSLNTSRPAPKAEAPRQPAPAPVAATPQADAAMETIVVVHAAHEPASAAAAAPAPTVTVRAPAPVEPQATTAAEMVAAAALKAAPSQAAQAQPVPTPASAPAKPAPARTVSIPGLPSQEDIERLNFIEKMALFS